MSNICNEYTLEGIKIKIQVSFICENEMFSLFKGTKKFFYYIYFFLFFSSPLVSTNDKYSIYKQCIYWSSIKKGLREKDV